MADSISGSEPLRSTADRHFRTASQAFDEHVQSQHLMCRIYDKYAGPDDTNHNCLGCNFDDLTDQISKVLRVTSSNSVNFDLHHRFSLIALMLNSCWERIVDVFEILGVPDGYRCRYFSPFICARRWANFFKHPKTFGWVVHHPTYTIQNSDHHKALEADASKYKFINEEFLKTYYAADSTKNAGKLRSEFRGVESSTVIVLPEISQLVEAVCDCLAHFVNIVTDNPIYVDILTDESTIENYFCPDPEAS